MTEAEWMKAKRPNYNVNVDLIYPYSELPFLGQYHLLKLPLTGAFIDHVDYWGEGMIETNKGRSGFPSCYNVNRQYQCVSNGPDRDKKIPNRVPVFDEEKCDSSSYIQNHSVKLVTLMAAPIVKNCAIDIARMIDPRVGSVVVFGFTPDSEYIRILREELSYVSLYYCPNYELPEYLQGLTLFDSHVAYLNATDISEELYNAVTGKSLDTALGITQSIEHNGGGSVLTDVIKKLLQQGIRYTMDYAYKLWVSGEKHIVNKYFPESFQLILNGDDVKIESHYYNMALKLDPNVDSYNDRQGWGDKQDHSSKRVNWTIIPIWENDELMFKIRNNEYIMFLKLDDNVDNIGDRICWGSNSSDEKRYTWSLEPITFKENTLFFIVNREYGQVLKLDAHTDSYGDRLLWGHNGKVFDNPNYFGWLIKSWL